MKPSNQPSIPRHQLYQTTAIDMAAYLLAQGFYYEVFRESGNNCAVFGFEDSPELRATICDYQQGGFAKRLLSARSKLYREASDVMRRGGCHA